MRVRNLVVAAVVAVVGPVPASATPTQPQVVDDCGDASSFVGVGSERLALEENKSHIDVKSGRVSGMYDGSDTLLGITATVELCGTASAADAGYGLGWSFEDGCTAEIGWGLPPSFDNGGEASAHVEGHVPLSDPKAPRFSEMCVDDTLPTAATAKVVDWSMPADSVQFDGATVTFEIRREWLPEELASRFTDGTPWSRISARALERNSHLESWIVADTGHRADASIRTDAARGGGRYVVGEDCACGQ